MNEQSIFNEALDRGDSAARSAYLDEACAGDLALRERVEALLTSHAEAGNFLGKLAPERIVEELKGEQTNDETQGENPEENKSSEEDLCFLTPSDKPGVLGRLGHYEVLEVIGRGGMGIVLRAFDDKLHRVVAIKVMASALAATSPPRKRFLREARAAAKVRHEHVVDIHAVEDQPIPYLVMEYVSGETLQQKLDRVGPLETPEVLRLGQQIARGLAAAHAQGLIHRDIKPSNILLEKGAEERVKITDFGLARAADDVSLTQSGMIAGTPMYMAPEQTLGEAIDHRADLFSLGSVLYTMCSGRPPFRATTSMATLKRVAEDQPRPIREIIPEVPEWLCDIIARLHAKKPEERFQSAKEVADLLGQCIQHLEHPTSAPIPANLTPLSPLGRGAGGEGRSQPATSTPFEHSGRATRRRRWAVAAAVLLFLLGGLSLTEATGVTELRATVIRIFTPDGTLVVETDDPAVKVTVEGDGGLVITGAGLEEIRLRPGSYRVQADRDGKPVSLEKNVVEVTRGGRAIVKVKVEAATVSAAAKAEKGAFVLLGGKGVAERKFDTFDEAVAVAEHGDVIEVCGNGPFVCEPISVKDLALVIRAGKSFQPVLELSPEGVKTARPLLETSALLVMEGLTLQTPARGDWDHSKRAPTLLFSEGSPLYLANCRLLAQGHAVHANQSPVLEFRNCDLPLARATVGYNYLSALAPAMSAGRLICDNNLLVAGHMPIQLNSDSASVGITRSTLIGTAPVALFVFDPEAFAKKADDASPPIRIVSSDCIFHGVVVGAFQFEQTGEPAAQGKALVLAEAERLMPRLVEWREQRNAYLANISLFYSLIVAKRTEGKYSFQSLAAWNQFWGLADTGSIQGSIRYQGGDLFARAQDKPEQMKPQDFRLHPKSLGYRAGPDGKDLGADVGLVGPGEAYERWKTTPAYQQWLKDTGQKK